MRPGGRPSTAGAVAALLAPAPQSAHPGTELLLLERRTDRPYDEQSPSTVLCIYGERFVHACSGDRQVVAALVREDLRRYGVELTADGVRP